MLLFSPVGTQSGLRENTPLQRKTESPASGAASLPNWKNNSTFSSFCRTSGISCLLPWHSSCQVASLGWLQAGPTQLPKEAEQSSCLQARKLSAFYILFYLLEGLELCGSQRTQVLQQLGVQDLHGAIEHPNYLL